MTAQEVYAEVDAGADTVSALVRAEKYGQARMHGVLIVCTGYASTEVFCAATALYAVRW